MAGEPVGRRAAPAGPHRRRAGGPAGLGARGCADRPAALVRPGDRGRRDARRGRRAARRPGADGPGQHDGPGRGPALARLRLSRPRHRAVGSGAGPARGQRLAAQPAPAGGDLAGHRVEPGRRRRCGRGRGRRCRVGVAGHPAGRRHAGTDHRGTGYPDLLQPAGPGGAVAGPAAQGGRRPVRADLARAAGGDPGGHRPPPGRPGRGGVVGARRVDRHLAAVLGGGHRPAAVLHGARHHRAGRHQDAATYLKTPVPDAMFQTPFGLHYLQARGGTSWPSTGRGRPSGTSSPVASG